MAYKKYGQDKEDRMHESRGMKKYEDKMGGDSYHKEFVAGHDPMVGRDSFAGMPEDKVMAKYPPNRMRRGGYLDDSMAEIDAIQMDSDHQVEKNLSHQK